MNKYFAMGLLGLATAQAEAATQRFCVGTDQELQLALNNAYSLAKATGQASTADILLRRNAQAYVLEMPFAPNSNDGFGGLRMLGGYSPNLADDCTEENRIVGSGNTKVVNVFQQLIAIRVSQDFLWEGVDILTTREPLWIEHFGKESGQISIRRSRIVGGLDLSSSEPGSTEFRVIGSTVSTSASHALTCALTIESFDQADIDATVANSTISSKPGDSGLCFKDLDSLLVQDSIIWNGGSDLGLNDIGTDETPTILRHNILPLDNNVGGLVGQHIGGTSSDPMFVDNQFRIALQSPAVDSGYLHTVYDLPDRDLDGHAREQGDGVDRGAFEVELAQTDELVVNSEGDSANPPPGVMTLRKALDLSNAIPGKQIIRFAVVGGGGSGCPTINLVTPLSDITDSVDIDGESQSGWHPNTSLGGFNATLCVNIKPVSGQNLAHALRVPTGGTASVKVSGLSFSLVTRAIVFNGGTNHVITGNRFYYGEQHISFSDAKDSRIGGINVSQRNQFERATLRAVSVRGQNNLILGNLFGPEDPFDSDTTNRNEVGLEVVRTGNTVYLNRFVKNLDTALELRGSDTSVFANVFVFNGRAIDVAQFFGIAGTGNDNELEDNLLLGNEEGVVLNPRTTGNRMTGNLSTATAGLGIDLGADGAVNPNGNGALLSPDAANKAQNYPLLLQAKTLDSKPNLAQVIGKLSARNGDYEIEVFADSACHDSGHGEGSESAATGTVNIKDGTPMSNGTTGFTLPVASVSPTTGLFLSATATDAEGNTSEFGACLEVAPAGTPQPLPDPIFSDGFEDKP